MYGVEIGAFGLHCLNVDKKKQSHDPKLSHLITNF